MGGLSIWHWMLVLLVVLLLFGGNKMSGLMGDFAKGIKAFKTGMKDEGGEEAAVAPPQVTPPVAAPGVAATSTAGERPAHDRG
jgi:sec-independent protein translocase protein TatA